ncbi:MAG: emrA1 [Myxococcaceae bacterium]|nr:emrA1 [Myxococcaceae bacterium]
MTTAETVLPEQVKAAPTPAALPRANRSRPYMILAGVVAVVLAGYLGVRYATSGHESTDDAQVAVDMVPISARVGGPILTLPVTDNQPVKAGDLLAQIDPVEYENKCKQSEALLLAAKAQADAADAQVAIMDASSRGGLSTARAALSGTTASVAGADAQIQAARAYVAKTQADADKAENDLRRAQALRKDDAIPQAQVDSLTSAAAGARAAVAQAQAQLAAAEDGKRSAQTRIAEAEGRVVQSSPVEAQRAAAKANADLAHARVASAEAALEEARLQLTYTKIVAPRDGHVSRVAVRAGQLVQPAQTITNVLPDATFLTANFKETQVGEIRPGQMATVVLDAFPKRTFTAKVDSIAFGTGAQFSLLPPDNASGNFVKVVQRVPVKLVWIDLPSDVRLEAGLSADVTVHLK